MISTLIRGGGVSLPNITKYREEYLVDTETNEIIYPKVLPSSIIGDTDAGDQTNKELEELRSSVSQLSNTVNKLGTQLFKTFTKSEQFNFSGSSNIQFLSNTLYMTKGIYIYWI